MIWRKEKLMKQLLKGKNHLKDRQSHRKSTTKETVRYSRTCTKPLHVKSAMQTLQEKRSTCLPNAIVINL